MKRLTPFAAAFLLSAAAAIAARAADAPDAKGTMGTIDAVTVYRGQALVTRLVDVPGPAGLKEIVVTNLPDQVEPGSIYAESEGGVDVASVSYSVRPVEKDVREEVQKFDDQIRVVQDKIAGNERRRQVIQAQNDYLTKLEAFTAGTSATELTKGVLNADTLMKMTQYQFEQRKSLSDEGLKADLELRDLNEQIQTLQRSRAQVAGTSSKLAREARILVNLTPQGLAAGAGGVGKMRVRYIVDNAAWLPSYNVRVGADRKNVTVEYLASIQQLTGEDWSNVQISLSTATPSMVAKAPLLNELAITSNRPGQGATDVISQIEQSGGSTQARQNLQDQRLALENVRGTIGANNSYNGNTNLGANNNGNVQANTINVNGTVVNLDYIGDNNDLDLYLNKTAADLQLVDLLAKEKIARTKDTKPVPLTPDEGLAITYNLRNRTSLQSRSDRQLIQIISLPLKADFYKVASPVLGTSVYDEASAVNDSNTVLLWGDVATYVNNEFVGRGVMPSVTTGQRFSVGLGMDSSLRARRELVEKSDTPQGGNRVVSYTYRLTIENFGAKAAVVRLLDRLPTAKEADIKVDSFAIAKDGPPLSKDPLFEQTDAKKGILRWDLEVPGQAIDDKAKSLEYSFKLEYAATAIISTPAPPPPAPNAGGGGAGGAGGGGFGGGGGRGGAGGRGG